MRSPKTWLRWCQRPPFGGTHLGPSNRRGRTKLNVVANGRIGFHLSPVAGGRGGVVAEHIGLNAAQFICCGPWRFFQHAARFICGPVLIGLLDPELCCHCGKRNRKTNQEERNLQLYHLRLRREAFLTKRYSYFGAELAFPISRANFQLPSFCAFQSWSSCRI